ncbi:hypothetical protein Val02_50740 [Virgisporangium aliadipatigenens]|uniref:Conjugal transfer protein TrbC n=1 Tax=Virgisporangium aliadipatigenens TaxID=741659 RepID=A0A8J3YQZ8_9ACTN|nr:hypothetical protein [Virgisporangium aliadipatigenens]GIJ48188.1 hypothetical protein Val02_50740 [Virgisporangium aliadipatigenens]
MNNISIFVYVKLTDWLGTVLGVPVGVPEPDKGVEVGQLSTMVKKVFGLVAWAGTAAGVLGILITGAMMTLSHKRGESSEHLSRLGMVLGGCVLVSTAGPIISTLFP